ncbi:Protein unc-13 4B like [Quillaja saponaria]|uniref:Protein unc-13 4B like n=1 Tax=Quillaja saponaria TaxID=32244 RepID=A0AAD7M691_QUISA|nr:Protein unc-13 4B like [Quillaja saponaria]
MVAKESYIDQEALLHDQGNTSIHFLMEEVDPYEAEEALSLCDLPMYGDSARWDDFSNVQTSNSSSNDGDDKFFEFFSEDFTASTRSSTTDKNVIFCGKIIPYKEPPHMVTNDTKQTSGKIKKGWSLFPWNSQSTRKLDFSVGKVSVLTSPTKFRWNLFLFGMTRFPTEMELRDMKTRQSRRGPQATAMVSASKEQSEVVKGTSRRKVRKGKGFCGIFRALGCSNRTAKAVAKASFGCLPNM